MNDSARQNSWWQFIQINSVQATAWGLLWLRVGTGGLIFYIHGWHKIPGAVDYLRSGIPWKLAEEIAAMNFPLPVLSAFTATTVQSVCSLFLSVGYFTRINAALLTGTLAVAVLQNVLAGRDPQLALLYTINAAAFTVIGGGRLSFDAWQQSRR